MQGRQTKNKTLPLLTEEERRKDTSEDHDIVYIKRILSGPEETTIDPKELINKGYVRTFNQGHIELGNGLIFYYYTSHTARVTQLRLRVAPAKFR